jgi:hypothetical protein
MGACICIIAKTGQHWPHLAIQLDEDKDLYITAKCSSKAGIQQIQSTVAFRLQQLPEAAQSIVLTFLFPGHRWAIGAASHLRAQSVVQHPEFWRHICTRGKNPATQPLADHIQEEVPAANWHKLARGVHVSRWMAGLPSRPLYLLLQDFSYKEQAWKALTEMQVQTSGGAQSSREGRRSVLSSPYLMAEQHFRNSGGVAISLEVEWVHDVSEEFSFESKAPRFWVHVSDPPSVPLSLRVLLPLQADNPLSGDIVDLRFDVRTDGLSRRLRVEEAAGTQTLDALKAALQPDRLLFPAVVQCCEADNSDGRPGGCGWIPWRPSQPSLKLWQSHHPSEALQCH